jgi:hypothetical protein
LIDYSLPYRIVSRQVGQPPFHYETDDSARYFIRDARGARVAQCENEEWAALVVDALNAVDGQIPPPPSPDPIEWTEEETRAFLETGDFPERMFW